MNIEAKLDNLIERAKILKQKIDTRNGVGSGRQIVGAVSDSWVNEQGQKVSGYRKVVLTI